MDENFLHLLANELGELVAYDEECPGVYYLCCIAPEDGIGREYYVVLKDAHISKEVRAMGTPMRNISALLYWMDSKERWPVKYEIIRYRKMHNLPLSEGESLKETALYGMEQCPDYFGAYPVPLSTPWGYTLRHRPLDNGIYYLETDQCTEVLAVCHPIWIAELSEGLLSIAGKLPHEGETGYCYFSRQTACVAIFELLRTRSAWITAGLIRKPELMNAIWEYQPAYALGYNAQEQAGLNDALGLLLYALGVENRELEGSPEQMITISPAKSTNYIGFWK